MILDKPKNDECEARIHYRIDAKSSAQYMRLRSPNRGGSCSAWSAFPTGYLSDYGAGDAYVCSPVCVIC